MEANEIQRVDYLLGGRELLNEGVNNDYKELRNELKKFRAILTKEIPSHHYAHVKLWSKFSDLEDAILKEL